MFIINAIKDLIIAKNIHVKIIKIAENEKANLSNLFAPQGYGTGTSYLDADTIHGTMHQEKFSYIIESISRLDNLIYIETGIIKNLDKEIKEIEEELKLFTGLKLKIKTMQLVQGKNLREIAAELKYSYIHVREVAADSK